MSIPNVNPTTSTQPGPYSGYYHSPSTAFAHGDPHTPYTPYIPMHPDLYQAAAPVSDDSNRVGSRPAPRSSRFDRPSAILRKHDARIIYEDDPELQFSYAGRDGKAVFEDRIHGQPSEVTMGGQEDEEADDSAASRERTARRRERRERRAHERAHRGTRDTVTSRRAVQTRPQTSRVAAKDLRSFHTSEPTKFCPSAKVTKVSDHASHHKHQSSHGDEDRFVRQEQEIARLHNLLEGATKSVWRSQVTALRDAQTIHGLQFKCKSLQGQLTSQDEYYQRTIQEYLNSLASHQLPLQQDFNQRLHKGTTWFRSAQEYSDAFDAYKSSRGCKDPYQRDPDPEEFKRTKRSHHPASEEESSTPSSVPSEEIINN